MMAYTLHVSHFSIVFAGLLSTTIYMVGGSLFYIQLEQKVTLWLFFYFFLKKSFVVQIECTLGVLLCAIKRKVLTLKNA